MLRQFTIRQRLLGSFSLLALLLFALGGLSLWAARAQNEAFIGFHERLMKSALAGSALQGELQNLRRFENDTLLNLGDTTRVAEFAKQWNGAHEKARSQLATFEQRTADAAARAKLAALGAALQAYHAGAAPHLIKLGDAALATEASGAVANARPKLAEASKLAEEVLGSIDVAATAVAAKVDALYGLVIAVTAGAMLAAVAGVALLGWRVSRSVIEPVKGAERLARDVAEGRLTGQIDTHGRDELAALANALMAMQASLRDIVGGVRSASENIQVASAEVASGNADLSQRTEHTASQLQQTASSMSQLTGTVRASAEAAQQANQLAASAAEVAARGGSVVGEVVATMESINTSSRKIADIIGTIDGIAFQTNILALNAAVEAARAGEQGRGFAVVAGEVRSLAQRSAEAAREIKSLIGASVENVENGSRLVADAGRTMNEIVAGVQRVSDIIGEITAAAGEQSQGIAQVDASIGQLDQMTQQNAALVEQSAAAAESLKDQAVRLASTVTRFELGTERRGSAPTPHKPGALAAPAPRTPVATAAAAGAVVKATPKPAPQPQRPAKALAAEVIARAATPATVATPAAAAKTAKPAAAAPIKPASAMPTAPTAAVIAPAASKADDDWETF